MKRRTFKSILINNLIKNIVIAVVILAAALIVALQITRNMAADKLDGELDNFMNNISLVANNIMNENPDMESEELGEKLYTTMKLSLTKNRKDNTAGAVYSYDNVYFDNIEFICDSEKTALLNIVEFDSGNIRQYLCDVDDIQEFADSYEEFSYQVIEDAYLLNNTFIPGRIRLYEENGSLIKVFDFTPEDTSGYTHCYYRFYGNSESKPEDLSGFNYFEAADEYCSSEYQMMGPLIYGADSDDANLVKLKQYIEDGSKWKNLNGNPDICEIKGLEVNCYGFDCYNTSGNGNFIIFYTVSVNLYDEYGGWIIGISLAVVLLSVIIAVIASYLRYTKLLAEYGIEDYRNTLTDSMAHDLKSPLMAISGYAENLRDNVHTEKKDYYASSILENVKYMNDIISNTLELSKLEKGFLKLKKEETDAAELIESLLVKYDDSAEQRNLKFSLTGSMKLKADRQLFLQAMDNLIGNAVKYSDRDGIIEIALDKKKITITNPCADDLGVDAASLCEPFVKGDNSKSNKTGIGIGLTIAKNIFEMHSLKVNIYCKENLFIVEILCYN